MKFFASESLSCRCTWAWFKMRYSWLPSCQAMLLLFSRGVVSNSPRPHGLHAARQASLSFTTSQSLLQFTSVELVMPSNHLILCCPPLLLLPLVFPSIRVFSNESALRIRWPNYWSFSFSISPSNEYSGLISFRINRFDLLTVQGTLKGHILSSSPSGTHPAMGGPCFHLCVC